MKGHSATFVHATPDGDKLIAEIARVSNPANQKNEETAPRLINYLLRHNHWSPFQMASMCIEVHTTRPIGRQILRHLSAIGYQEFSGRYAEYGELNDFLECRFQHPTNRQLSRLAETPEEWATVDAWNKFVRNKAQEDEDWYKYWLSRGVAKEQVRGILPEGLVPTRMYLHYSIRTWIHYIEERIKEGVQAEHRAIALECQRILQEQYPMVAEALRIRAEGETPPSAATAPEAPAQGSPPAGDGVEAPIRNLAFEIARESLTPQHDRNKAASEPIGYRAKLQEFVDLVAPKAAERGAAAYVSIHAESDAALASAPAGDGVEVPE